MNTTYQNSTTRIWYLSGLTGFVLMAGMLLGEGQARIYTPTPLPTETFIQSNNVNRQIDSSEAFHPTHTKKIEIQKSHREAKPHSLVPQKEPQNESLTKKRMGLAMLFLGILAEER